MLMQKIRERKELRPSFLSFDFGVKERSLTRPPLGKDPERSTFPNAPNLLFIIVNRMEGVIFVGI